MELQNLPRDDAAYAETLRSTGSVNHLGEFRQWLHIWTVDTNDGTGCIHNHTALPWVAIWDKPDLSLLMATYHMTDFVNLPPSWETLWYDLGVARASHRERPDVIHGPFWMLQTGPSVASLAGELIGMKRGVTNELFKRIGTCKDFPDLVRQEYLRALEPLRVMSPQQELEDETVRAAEKRSDAVRVWDSAALGRPPRCR